MTAPVALITGESRGVGRALSLRLADGTTIDVDGGLEANHQFYPATKLA